MGASIQHTEPQPRKVGERLVTAEVVQSSADGWVSLLIRDCTFEITQVGARTGGLRSGSSIKRKMSTLIRGKVERLQWNDESARAIVASRYLGIYI